jgi:hypothetical protein
MSLGWTRYGRQTSGKEKVGKLQRKEKEVGTLEDPMAVRFNVESTTQPNPAKLDNTTI